jgi:hypothetical protein
MQKTDKNQKHQSSRRSAVKRKVPSREMLISIVLSWKNLNFQSLPNLKTVWSWKEKELIQCVPSHLLFVSLLGWVLIFLDLQHKIFQELTLHLMLVISSVVWEKEEKIINFCILPPFQELEHKCINRLFALRLAQPQHLLLLVQLVLQFLNQ